MIEIGEITRDIQLYKRMAWHARSGIWEIEKKLSYVNLIYNEIRWRPFYDRNR